MQRWNFGWAPTKNIPIYFLVTYQNHPCHQCHPWILFDPRTKIYRVICVPFMWKKRIQLQMVNHVTSIFWITLWNFSTHLLSKFLNVLLFNSYERIYTCIINLIRTLPQCIDQSQPDECGFHTGRAYAQDTWCCAPVNRTTSSWSMV